MFSKYFLILLILLFPFGQLTRIPIISGTATIYLHDILIVLFLAINSFRPEFKQIFKKLNNKAIFAFIISSTISLLLALTQISIKELIFSSLYLVRFVAYILFIYLVKNEIKDKKTNFEPYIIVSIILTLVFGFGQYFIFPALEPITAAGWDRHLNRLAGSWLDTGFTGLILVLQLHFLINRLFSNKNKKLTYIDIVLSALVLIAILLTYSRSSYLALFIGLIIIFKKKSVMYLLGICIFLGIGILILPRTFGEGTKLLRTSTINSRFISWQQGLNLFVNKPIFGYGFNTIRYIKRDVGLEQSKWLSSHSASGFENSFIFLLVTTGALGTGLFFYWIWKLFKSNQAKSLIISSLGIIAAHGMFANSWFYPWVILWMGIIMIAESTKTKIEI